MIISSDQLKAEQVKIWPNLQFIWPTNPMWTAVSDDWFKKLIKNCSTTGFTSIPGIWECENYTHQFKANVEKYQYELYQSGEFKPEWRWAVGESIGIKKDFTGNTITHGMNIIRLESGIVVFEPQENTWKDEGYDYEPFFAKF